MLGLACIVWSSSSTHSFGTHSFGALPAFAASPVSSQSEPYSACRSLKPCLDILDRHAPDSFDYRVLANDFYRLGTAGKQALLTRASGQSFVREKALQILSQRAFNFTMQEQSELSLLWPEVLPETLAHVFISNMSPLFAQNAVRTLTDVNPDVQRLSREILHAANQQDIRTPLSSGDERRLRKALQTRPHPAIIERLLTLPNFDRFSVLSPVLQSGDTPSVLAAYSALEAQDSEQAFQVLVKTVFALKDETETSTQAVSELIQSLHTARPDGFYPRFAGDVARDPRISPLGRLAGLDAFISLTQGKTPLGKDREAVYFEAYQAALERPQNLGPQWVDFALTTAQTVDEATQTKWFLALDRYFQTSATLRPSHARFIQGLSRFETLKTRAIVADALNLSQDYRVQIEAIGVSAAWGQNSAILSNVSRQHPLSVVRVAAQRAIGERVSKNQPTALRRENISADYCRKGDFDMNRGALEMPYFSAPIYQNGVRASRSDLKSAASLKDGWLAAYQRSGDLGGLYYFDYNSDAPTEILDQAARVVLPIRDLPLGQFETEFWVITQSDRDFVLNRVSFVGGIASTNPVYVLPEPVTRVSRGSNDNWLLSFNPEDSADATDYNPPLSLSQSGTITRGCDTASPNSARGSRP